jgi:hypothetical protein
MVAGDTPIEKSWDALIVSVTEAEWVNEPDVPVTVSGKLPVDAATDSVTVCVSFTGMLSGKAGEVVAAEGKPEIETIIEPVNPFCAVVETVKLELEVPAVALTVAGETTISKSLIAVFVEEGLGPLLHPTKVDSDIPMPRISSERQ